MLTELFKTIQSADASDIDDILHIAIERKRYLFPDWDILYLAVPKNDKEAQSKTLEYIQKWCFR